MWDISIMGHLSPMAVFVFETEPSWYTEPAWPLRDSVVFTYLHFSPELRVVFIGTSAIQVKGNRPILPGNTFTPSLCIYHFNLWSERDIRIFCQDICTSCVANPSKPKGKGIHGWGSAECPWLDLSLSNWMHLVFNPSLLHLIGRKEHKECHHLQQTVLYINNFHNLLMLV